MNLTSYTYQKKCILLLACIFVLMIIAYQLAIKKTVTLYHDCRLLQGKLEDASRNPERIGQVKEKIALLDSTLNASGSNGFSLRQELLEKTAEFCISNPVTLIALPSPVFNEKDDIIIETNILTLEGSFSDLLRFTHLLEKSAAGKVVAVEFQAKYSVSLKKNILTEKIYVQLIKKNEHES